MSERYRTKFLAFAAVILLSGLGGVMDISNQTMTGYQTDGNNKVIQVTPGGPAEAAGLQVDDMITSIAGIGVEDDKAQAARPRAAIGEVRTYEVMRNGSAVSLDVTHAELQGTPRMLAYLGAVVGLCFLLFGLWAYLRGPTPATTLLAILGLTFGLAFLGTPYFESLTIRNLVSAVVVTIVLLGFAVLLHFLLAFPSRRPFLGRASATKILYGPAILVAVLLIWVNFFQPNATSTLNLFFRIVIGLFFVGYLGLSLLTFLRSYASASTEARASSGLNLMLVGTVLGLGPSVVSGVIGLVSPSTILPGSQYYFLLLGLLPITFALATTKAQSIGGTASAP